MENLPSTCPFCKSEIEPGAKACEVCGRSLSDAVGSTVEDEKNIPSLVQDLPKFFPASLNPESQPPTPPQPVNLAGAPTIGSYPTESAPATPRQIFILVGAVVLVACLLVAGGTVLFQMFMRQVNEQAAVASQTSQVLDREATRTAQAAEQTQAWEDYAARTTQQALETEFASTSKVVLAEAQSWPIVLEDRFDDEAGGWNIDEGEDDYSYYIFGLQDGAYRLEMTAKTGVSQWFWPDLGDNSLEQFYLAADMTMSGPENMDGGLIFHLGGEDDNDFYLFDVVRNGDASLYKHDAVNSWTMLSGYITSDAFSPDGGNRLEIIGKPAEGVSGRQFDFFINGVWITQVIDDTFSGGWIGLQVGLSNEGDVGVWTFDNLELRAP